MTALADLGQAQLGSKDTVVPSRFLDFDADGTPREIWATDATDLIGKTDTGGQSAFNKARVAYQAVTVKDRADLPGVLCVDADGADKGMADSLANELIKNLLNSKSRFDHDNGALKIGDIALENVKVNGQQGYNAVTGLRLTEEKRSGFLGVSTV